MKVDFDQTYLLEKIGKRGSFTAEYASDDSAAACLEKLRHLFRGEEVPREPVKFHWAEGSRLHDVLLSTLPSELFSDRCLSILESIGSTGWLRYPVDVRGKDGELIEGYNGLAITGRCGSLQLDRSRLETRIGVSGKPYKVKIGLYFDEATWDGSDVFTPADSTFVFVTDKVKRAFEKAKITNVAFKPLDRFERLW